MVDESSRQQLAEHAFEAGLHRWPVQPLGAQQRAQQRCIMLLLGDVCCWHTECVSEWLLMPQRRRSHTHARVPSDGLCIWVTLVSVGETWWFSKHLRVCGHEYKQVLRTVTDI